MYPSIKFARIIKVMAVLTVFVVGQVVAAQSTDVEPTVPQWVINRQQYEPNYVYVPPQIGDVEPTVPQWVINRQQYEPNYVYVPPQIGDVEPTVPRWVVDR